MGNQWFGTHWNKKDKAKDSHSWLSLRNEINFDSYGDLSARYFQIAESEDSDFCAAEKNGQ